MKSHEIQEYIKLVESIETDSASIQEIRDILEPIVGHVFLGTPVVDTTLSLYRAVKLINKPKSFLDIIYPPKQYLTKYQRLNEPYCPVFYCSTSMHASVFEGRFKEGDLVTISQWEVIPGKYLITTIVGYTEHLSHWSNRDIPNWHKEVRINNLSDEAKETNRIILDFLSELFCKNFDKQNSKYKLSIAISNILGFNTESEAEFNKISNQHYKGTKALEAFIYPSILMNAQADNFAIRRFSFHKKIKFVSAEYVQIISITEKEFNIREIDFANEIVDHDIILWKGRKGNFVVPSGVGWVLTNVGINKFTLLRKDGGKLYKD